MGWVDKVVHKMRRCNLLREQLCDLTSPPDEIYRPKGMRRRHFQRKVRLLARLEASIEAELDLRLGRWYENKRPKQNTGEKRG